ncbi:hypothetical protein EV127DRAFT_183210 [Xylaria flabelliformis]|nr:hypothetical protein EV127DRAFT_183210 [Xylaria flabelliformis]
MCLDNTQQIVCGKDLSNPDVQPVICAWSILKMLAFLVAHNFNHTNVYQLFEDQERWDALLEAANVLDAVVEECKRINDPHGRRLNNVLATEVRNQLHWARANPTDRPLLFRNARGSWVWDPSAHDMNTVYRVAARSGFIPALPIPGLHKLGPSDGNNGRGISPPQSRGDPSIDSSDSASQAPTNSEQDRPSNDEEPINRMATILHRAADLAQAESQRGDPVDAGELAAILEQVEEHRDNVRAAIWGWKVHKR